MKRVIEENKSNLDSSLNFQIRFIAKTRNEIKMIPDNKMSNGGVSKFPCRHFNEAKTDKI